MIFDPDQQTNFLDLMRPPLGYRLDAAVGTTYSMDFVALTALMLAFVDGEAEGDREHLNDGEALQAISRLAKCVRVFVNRGQISGLDSARYGRLSGLYDQIVREIHFERGAFHPKVWVARYVPKATASAAGKRALVRVVCASRNLATSSCWEVFAAFDGMVNGVASANGLNREVGGFLRHLRNHDRGARALLESLEKTVSQTRFDQPDSAVGRCHFLWKWNDDSSFWRQVPSTGTQALLVSPFIGEKFLERLVSGYERLILVSTQEELDALDDDFYQELVEKSDLFVMRSAVADNDEEVLQLHAKLYICESPVNRLMFLGSANASASGWFDGNCEAVMSFSPGVSIDRFSNQFIYAPGRTDKGDRNKRCWIKEYDRRATTENERDRIGKELDRVQNIVAGLVFRASYSPQLCSLRITCPTFAAAQAELGEYRLGLCPLPMFKGESNLLPADALGTTGMEFDRVRVADLSEFLLVGITHPASASKLYLKQFVVKAIADFDHLRGDRDSAVLAELLTPETFRQYLRAILFDGVAKTTSITPPGSDTAIGCQPGETHGLVAILLGDITLEDLLQSCTEDLDRVEEIDRLLQLFEQTKMADGEIEQFKKLWTAIRSAFSDAKGAIHG